MFRRSLLICGLIQVMLMQGFTFDADDCAVVKACWHDRVWRHELENASAESKNWHYAQELVAFTDEDIAVASQLVSLLCSKKMWEDFLANKRDVDTTMRFVRFMTIALQKYIAEDCQMAFPPHLQDIDAEIVRSGLSQEEFCTRLRQTFLTFTILVSHMDQLARQGS